ncbi:diguanylate cyclase [Sulfurimonas sp.]|uniref:diguanylate cyclase n=1 Tax=Sulfurimonas sp. TaxID=2022749 RepID=UPI0035671BBD
MAKKSNRILFLVFVLLSIAILLIGNQFKDYKVSEYTSKKYDLIAQSLSNEVATLIQEKKNATLAMAISFSKSDELKNALLEQNQNTDVLKRYSKELQESTDFKNVWIQIINRNGISLARSWTDRYGDDLASIREDVRSMNNNPRINSTISIGRYDLTFKSMVPIYDKTTNYIGYIEIVTHFNSIAKKIEKKKFEPVILVNEKYVKQITYPFTKLYSNNNYIANNNADKKLIDYISKNGLGYFISPYKNYIIDKEKNYIVINYTLFDTSKKPMANFLMFKSLNDIDMSAVNSIKSTINLFILLTVVVTAIFFYFISNKENINIEVDSKLSIAVFGAIFIFISFIYYLALTWNFEQKRDSFFQKYNQNIKKDYHIIQHQYSSVAKTIYNTIINKPKIVDLLSFAYEGEKQKDIARKKLYDALVKDYEYFKTHEIRQLHFHLRNNDSFLRFHRPQKYGDSLIGVRSTVEWVNKNKTMIEGFEEGRIFNGFRHVYPLFSKKYSDHSEHVGSVEISFSAYAIATEFAEVHDVKASFIINENVVKDKVFKKEQKNYEQSPFRGYLYEKSIKNQFAHSFTQTNIKLLSIKQIEQASNIIINGEVFSIQSTDENVIFTFMPLKNPVTKNVVAAIILQKDSYELSKQDNLYNIFLFSGILAILFVLMYIYKEFSSKNKFRMLSLKTQKILDAQHSIVVITDGKQIKDANKKLLVYFGYKSIDEFRRENDCICNFFEKDDRFFHLGKIDEEQEWINEIDKLPFKEHIVAMRDFKGKQNIFFVSVSHFDNNHIVSFSNISDTMAEHFSLMERVVHDKLTGAYNRDYFDSRKELWLQELSYKKVQLGIIILDIDNFKSINDTYGHNVGDVVLKQIVSIIELVTRQEDTLIRWGGEEFLLVSYVSSLDDLYNIAENIRKKIENELFEKVGLITCSFGVTLYKSNEDVVKDTIERADQALYEAKQAGKNRVVSK